MDSVLVPFRADSRIAENYNSGLVVFLYDEAHGAAIRGAAPSILEGFHGDENDEDKALRGLAAEGKLVVFELEQDDELCIEVSVGPPLAAKEKRARRAKTLKVQKSRLDLPSGRLCIDSYDTLRLRDEEPDQPGATLAVPPGEYALQLLRLDLDAFHEESDEEWDGPAHVVVLSPAAETKPPKRPRPILRFADAAGAPKWVGKGTVTGDRFEGLVVGAGKHGITVNLDRRHARALGLVRGARLELTLADRGGVWHALYLGPSLARQQPIFAALYPPEQRRRWLEGVRERTGRPRAEFLIAEHPRHSWDCLGLTIDDRVDPEPATVLGGLPEMARATVRVLADEPFHAIDPDAIDRWTAEAGVVRGAVLAASVRVWVTSFPPEALAHLGAEPGSDLVVEAAGTSRRLRVCGDGTTLSSERRAFMSSLSPGRRQEVDRLREALRQGFVEYHMLDPGDPREEELAARNKELMAALDAAQVPDEAREVAPVGATWRNHWDLPDRQVLELEPLAPLELDVVPEIGSTVVLRVTRSRAATTA